LFVFLLEKIPPPDESDVAERTERLPMTKEDRKLFLKLFSFGIITVTVTYLFLSIMRDIRDNYMANIWNELDMEMIIPFLQKQKRILQLSYSSLSVACIDTEKPSGIPVYSFHYYYWLSCSWCFFLVIL